MISTPVLIHRLVMVGVLLAGGFLAFLWGRASRCGEGQGVAETRSARLDGLLKERRDLLRDLSTQVRAAHAAGQGSFDFVRQASRDLLAAELEACGTDAERISVLEKFIAQAKEHEQAAEQRFQSGIAPKSDLMMATALRLEIEIDLERMRSGKHPGMR